MVPSAGDGGGGDGGPGPELPPSTSAEGVKGRPGLQRSDRYLQRCLRTQPDEQPTELLSGV